MKKVLSFDIDQTLNIAKTPITPEIADLLANCLDYFEICPISGQKFDQFLIQIVNELKNATPRQLTHLHLFVAQGTQYYRFAGLSSKDRHLDPDQPYSNQNPTPSDWELVYDYPLTKDQIAEMMQALEQAARELGYWEEDMLQPGDEIVENRHSQVTFSALGQAAGTDEKYSWDPDCKKRQKIAARALELAPDYVYEVAGTTSINAVIPGRNKQFGMTHLLEELKVEKQDVLYFGDMTQPGGNDYPVVEMGFDTITVRNHEDTAYALRGILGALK